MRKIRLLSIFIFLLICGNSSAQVAGNSDIDVVPHDTTTLAWRPTISNEDFKFQVSRFLDIMQKGKPLKNIDDCIILVRLFNTLFPDQQFHSRQSECFDKDTCDQFYKLFLYNYFFVVVYNKLSFRRRKGGEGHYSNKYDLGLGSTSFEPTKRSDYYVVIWK